MAIPDSAKELAYASRGDNGRPNARIYQLKSGKYALHVFDASLNLRQYRHAELDQLIALALAEERDDEMRAAIREAVYAAQDKIEA